MSVALRLALQEERASELAGRIRRLLGPFAGTEVALDSGCGTGSLAFALAPHVGDEAPDFDLPVLHGDGERVRLSDLRGQAVALIFGSYT